MVINSYVFGKLDICADKVIFFPEGLPGFEHLNRFIIVILNQTRPFLWLQAIDEDVSIPVISPFDINHGYSPTIDDDSFLDLKLDNYDDLLVLAVAVIPKEVNLMTANLAAPVLINLSAGIGKQVIAEGDEYLLRQPIFEKICRLMKENVPGDDQVMKMAVSCFPS